MFETEFLKVPGKPAITLDAGTEVEYVCESGVVVKHNLVFDMAVVLDRFQEAQAFFHNENDKKVSLLICQKS